MRVPWPERRPSCNSPSYVPFEHHASRAEFMSTLNRLCGRTVRDLLDQTLTHEEGGGGGEKREINKREKEKRERP